MEFPGYLRSNKGVLSIVTRTVSCIRRLLKRLKAHFLKFMLSVCQYFGVALKTFQTVMCTPLKARSVISTKMTKSNVWICAGVL